MKQSCMPEQVCKRRVRAAALTVALSLSLPLFADSSNPFNAWKFDVIHLKNGNTLKGLVVGETKVSITLEWVVQRPGEPTRVVITHTMPWSDVDRIDRLKPSEREVLAARLKELKPASEKERMEKLELKRVPWGKDDKGGLSYTSQHFVLVSNASHEIVRRAALRLEEIYAAYARLLPPRRQQVRPTTILLVRSLAEYQELLKSRGHNLANPAFYDAARNEIVCASDLERLGERLEELRKNHQEKWKRLNEQEAAWKKVFNGTIPPKYIQELKENRDKIEKADKENEKHFKEATQRLFRTLYHEAFHAYLANFVYPLGEVEVPRWLNEGLAQIFETAILEAGELRLGHADPKRFARVKEAENQHDLLKLADLLQAGPKQFLVNHASERQISDQYYLASWALAFYLTFERHKLGTPELDKYVLALKDGMPPLEAFRQLVGQPLPDFEKVFHEYLRDLRLDGTTERLTKEKQPKQ